jgi:hypothetical protein
VKISKALLPYKLEAEYEAKVSGTGGSCSCSWKYTVEITDAGKAQAQIREADVKCK